MKSKNNRFALLVCTLGLRLFATEQLVTVTSQTLDGWMVAGTTMPSGSMLALPPGSQLTRSVPPGSLSVHLVTQPVFGLNSTDWPVLEIGSAALVFARVGDTGQLVFAIGDNEPVTLPWSFALDAAGRSIAPLDLKLGRNGGTLTVSNAGSTLQFPAGPAEGPSLEVVVSAGQTESWSFDKLVMAGSAVDNNPAVPGQNAGAAPTGAPRAKDQASPRKGDVLDAAYATSPAPSAEATSAKPVASTASAPTASTLEVFTPPSVRRGRADAVRAMLAKPQGS